MFKVISSEPEQVAVFGMVRQLPARPVTARSDALLHHFEITVNHSAGSAKLFKPGARQREQLCQSLLRGARWLFGCRCCSSSCR